MFLFNFKGFLRLLLALIIFYVFFESLARYRFEYNNPTLPLSIRANMGLNSYEAMRFNAKVDEVSLKGIHYLTDEYGFRHGGKEKTPDKPTILLGGDSRVFGYSLKYENTVAAILENSGNYNIYQQAYPGSSPAIFNYGIFEKNLYSKLKLRPNYILYAYDRCDCYNDDVFNSELKENEKGTKLRKLKLMVGGYAWNMCMKKLSVFLNQKKPFNETKEQTVEVKKNETVNHEAEEKKTKNFKITDIPVRTSILNELKNYSLNSDVALIIMYLPRSEELYLRDTRVRDRILNWTKNNQIVFIDGYKEFDDLIQGDLNKMRPFFLDLNEGIHFSAKGCALVSALILKKMKGLD